MYTVSTLQSGELVMSQDFYKCITDLHNAIKSLNKFLKLHSITNFGYSCTNLFSSIEIILLTEKFKTKKSNM